MNENPEGTPNPLNQNPGAAPMGQGVVPPVPAAEEPMMAENPASESVAPQPLPEEPVQPIVTESIESSVTTEEPKGSVVEPTKKSHKPAIIVAIILFIVAIVAGVAAAIIVLDPFGFWKSKADAVPTAMSKLMSNDAPKLVSIEGNLSLTSADATFPYTSLAVKFQTGINGNTNENYVTAIVTATFPDESEFTFNVDEIQTSGNNLYLKLSGLADALNNYEPPMVETTNCIDGEEGTNCVDLTEIDTPDCNDEEDGCAEVEVILPEPSDSVLDFIGVFEVIDDEWIRISGSEFSTLTDMVSLDSSTQCLIGAADNLGEYGSNFAKMYNDNQFITYSTENLKIAQKSNQLYRIGFDADKLAGFINAMNNSGFMNEMLSCMGGQAISSDTEVTASDLSAIINELPVIYVEIDDNNNFTRLYLSMDGPDGMTSVTADLSFSYPDNIPISEPEEYIEINEVLSRLLTMFYGEDVYDFTLE